MIYHSTASTARSAVSLAAFVYALSWLLPNHHWPWADFYSDIWAAGVVLTVAAVVLWHTRYAFEVTWHTLPLLALTCIGIVWVQYATSLIATLGVAWTTSLYLTGFMLALLMGGAWERWRSTQCAEFLFLAVLIGSTGSLLIQLQQWLRIDTGAAFWLFLPAPPSRFFGNLGQPNQLATLMCMGVFACAWLHERGRLSGGVAWSWAALLAGGLALTESRTTWLVVFVALIAVIAMRKRLTLPNSLIASTLAWTGIFTFFVLGLPHVNVWLGRASELQSVRGISGFDLRLEYWAKSWEALLRHPWTGYGWMQASFAQFTPDPYAMVTGGTMRHTHNLFVDLGVELGIPLSLAVAGVLAIWASNATRRIREREQLWMLLFVAALGVHAMLEFPLYYAYFLLPFGLMLGALNETLGTAPVLRTRTWIAAVLLAFAGAGLVVTVRDYLKIEEDFFALRFEDKGLAKATDRVATPDAIVLTHLDDMLWLARVDPVKTHTAHDLERAVRTMKILPSLMGNYKLAAMYSFADQPEQAAYWIIVMTRMNGLNASTVKNIRGQWEEQAMKYPPMAKVTWPK